MLKIIWLFILLLPIVGSDAWSVEVKQVIPPPPITAKEINNTQISDNQELSKWTDPIFLVTCLLAVANFLMWKANRDLVRGADRAAERQSKEVQAAITEAVRSANAMEDVAEATKNNATLIQNILHKQMRAYLAVEIGVPAYQNDQVKFASSPVLVNTGFTPAKNVSYKIMADILDAKLPVDFQFPDYGEMQTNDASLGPRQNFVIQGIIKDRIPSDKVQEVMNGNNKKLYVWGTVTYEDIFGGRWETNFCHNFIFYMNEGKINFLSYYNHTHNNAT
ncbi:MAG: hypothetical protein ACYCSS_04650 [Sulfuriferula sp.]